MVELELNVDDTEDGPAIEPPPLKAALSSAEPIYILPKDDIAQHVLIPALGAASAADVMMGFFSSHALGEIAPGLATYLSSTQAPLRLVISPFLSASDREAISQGVSEGSIVERFLDRTLPDADEIGRHTLTCFAWLISQGRLQVKIALMRDALFHPKVWLFEAGDDVAALHGSANMTQAGLAKNREQLSLSRSWNGPDASTTCRRLQAEFAELWSGGDGRDCVVVDLPRAVEDQLLRDFKSDRMPVEEDFRRLWRKAQGLPEAEPQIDFEGQAKRLTFEIPSWLNYQTGEFSHQGAAVDAWEKSGWRGILEMATGAGKTLTAMVGACKLHQVVGPLLIVVSAPYKVLVQQWCGEVEPFGLRAIDLTAAAGPKGRQAEIAAARRRLRLNISPSEVLVVSNATLATPEFIAEVAKYDGPKLLIADECHNLGAEAFVANRPECFEYRLGLSATPVRQYDDAGTRFLFDYFGDACFSFTLEQAIGRCLTPYDYHVHFAPLSESEMVEWRELSAEISRLSWKFEAGVKDERLESLLLKRRRVLETASSKIPLLAQLLQAQDLRALKYTLIYATDKDPDQLEAVNQLLSDGRVLFHQLTADETANRKKTADILTRFQEGKLQVLTAKRVLDEGVNVPQIMQAFVLASTTVRRQWVQRRGRLLRTCKAIGKTHAVIHDLVTLPPEELLSGALDADARKIVNAELDRVWEFARLSRNGAVKGGPFEAVERLRDLMAGGD